MATIVGKPAPASGALNVRSSVRFLDWEFRFDTAGTFSLCCGESS